MPTITCKSRMCARSSLSHSHSVHHPWVCCRCRPCLWGGTIAEPGSAVPAERVADAALALPVVTCFQEPLCLQTMMGQGLQPGTLVGNLVMQGLHVAGQEAPARAVMAWMGAVSVLVRAWLPAKRGQLACTCLWLCSDLFSWCHGIVSWS